MGLLYLPRSLPLETMLRFCTSYNKPSFIVDAVGGVVFGGSGKFQPETSQILTIASKGRKFITIVDHGLSWCRILYRVTDEDWTDGQSELSR